MADCGTVAKYHAHYREEQKRTPEGEKVKVTCEPCLAALAEDKTTKRREAKMQAADDFKDALAFEPEVEDDLDELEDLKDNLRLVRARMRVGKSDPGAAALSKQRMDIVRRIEEIKLERNKSGGVLGGFESELGNVLRFEGRTGT